MGRLGVVIAGLLLATGCRQILGIDDPSVAPPVIVTGRVHLRSTHIAPEDTVIADDRIYGPGEITVSAWLDGDTSTAVTIDDAGTFAFERASMEQRYRVRVGTPYGEQEYQHTAEHLELSDRLAGRAEPRPPTMRTLLKVQTTGVVLGTPVLLSTGVWSSTQVPTSSMIELDWNTVAALPRDLLRADLNDRLYLGTYLQPSQAEPYSRLGALATTAVTLVNGTDTSVTMPAQTPMNVDSCVRLVARRAAATARLRAAAPLFETAIGATDFRIFTIPHIEASLYTQLLLVFDSSATSDANLDVRYPTPLPGQTMIGLATQLTRSAGTIDQEDSTTLVAGGLTVETLVPGEDCATKELLATTAIAGNPSIAGVTVTADSSEVALPMGPVEVTWSIAVTGQVDYYIVDLQDVRAKALKITRRVITTDPRVVFDRDLFKPGGLYVVNVSTVHGQPGASAGDFDTRISPFGITSIVSPTFRPGT
jgi:hypothetical protein